LGLVLYSRSHAVDAAGFARPSATLVAVIIRMAVTFAENVRILAASRREALTDPLTGLGNRRRLLDELQAVLDSGRPHALMIFDLDGFKRFNDTFGHPAGDALLSRLGERLRDAVAAEGEVYRLGGDEFCALVRAGPRPVEAIARAALLHDVGKVAIPAAILAKPGALDKLEWALMHEHTLIGERILAAAPALRPVAPVVRASHERYDGRGYPDGISGERIP